MKRQVPDHELLALDSHPYHRYLRATVLIERGQMRERSLCDLVAYRLWNLHCEFLHMAKDSINLARGPLEGTGRSADSFSYDIVKFAQTKTVLREACWREVPVGLGDRVGWGSCSSGQRSLKLTLYDALLAE
jgi:hypothetical protein